MACCHSRRSRRCILPDDAPVGNVPSSVTLLIHGLATTYVRARPFARYFQDLSKNVFRFLPLRLAPSDLERMHGTNERIAVRDYERAIRFYRQLILNAAGR